VLRGIYRLVRILFRSNLHEELNLCEKVNICYIQGMTVRNTFERLGIDEKNIGMIIRGGLCIMPSDLIEDEDSIELFPFYMGG